MRLSVHDRWFDHPFSTLFVPSPGPDFELVMVLIIDQGYL